MLILKIQSPKLDGEPQTIVHAETPQAQIGYPSQYKNIPGDSTDRLGYPLVS